MLLLFNSFLLKSQSLFVKDTSEDDGNEITILNCFRHLAICTTEMIYIVCIFKIIQI